MTDPTHSDPPAARLPTETRLLPLARCSAADLAEVRFVLCDLDDTLTLDGRLPSASYASLEALEAVGRRIIVVTGRPAGWCDMIARFWPISAVVGENGAFYFRYDHAARKMRRKFQRSVEQRSADRARLDTILGDLRRRFPDIHLSEDQPFRISDLAVDYCEDVEPLAAVDVSEIVRIFETGGATAKISSIHVNAWIGDFDKLQMSLALLRDDFEVAPDDLRRRVIYVGDSPNDGPMFAYFPLSVGVANIEPFLGNMRDHPRWIASKRGGLGFAELANIFLG